MDPRQHVAAALARLLAHPEELPPRDSPSFRNRLLDEAGGDYRTLVIFLLQLSEAGLPERMQADVASGTQWSEVRGRLVVEWTYERFSQPDVTQWAIDAWGTALGLYRPSEATAPSRSPNARAPARSLPSASVAPPRAVRATSVALATPAPLPHWVRTSASQARVASAVSASSSALRNSTPPRLSPSAQFAIAVIGTSVLVALFALSLMPNAEPAVADASFARSLAPPSAPDSVMRTVVATLPRSDLALVAADTLRLTNGESLVGRAEWSDGRRLRFRDVTRGVTFVEPLTDLTLLALAGGPRLDSVSLSRHSLSIGRPDSSARGMPLRGGIDTSAGHLSGTARDDVRAAALLSGDYRVSVRRSRAYGNAECGALDSSMAWNQDFVEHIAVTEDSARFRFTTRPTISGRVFADGSFQSAPVQRDRPAARTIFLLTGRLTPEGFVASGDTRTQSTIRYRQTRSCRFVADLVGTRIR